MSNNRRRDEWFTPAEALFLTMMAGLVLFAAAAAHHGSSSAPPRVGIEVYGPASSAEFANYLQEQYEASGLITADQRRIVERLRAAGDKPLSDGLRELEE